MNNKNLNKEKISLKFMFLKNKSSINQIYKNHNKKQNLNNIMKKSLIKIILTNKLLIKKSKKIKLSNVKVNKIFNNKIFKDKLRNKRKRNSKNKKRTVKSTSIIYINKLPFKKDKWMFRKGRKGNPMSLKMLNNPFNKIKTTKNQSILFMIIFIHT